MKVIRAGLLSAVALFSTQTAAKPVDKNAPKQMNIVFVLVDDLRYDAVGFLNKGLQTPNIDRLAKEGVYFPNAVVTSALCSPSRATILTGQSPRNHRVIDNNNSSEKGLTFFPAYMQKQGYQTAFIGKWHMGDATDMPRAGFDKWVSFKGQGNYFPTENLPPKAVSAGARHTINVDGKTVPQTGYITDELTDYAVNWLQNERDPKKPFFLYLSHKAVHSDPLTAERYRGQYADLKIDLPDTMADTPENRIGKPIWAQNQRNSWHGVEFLYHTNRPLPEQMRDYYRTLSPVDDSLGRVMAYLKKNKLEKNTMVVFTSDNGFSWGEHGLIDKRTAYQTSVRVPLVVWAPGTLPKGTTNQAVIRNQDYASTFVAMAGAELPRQFEGANFLPVASGTVSPKDWKSGDFIYEYYWEWTFPQTPTTFAIQRDGIKYIQYHGVWDTEEVYDLNKDPDEKVNLVNDPTYLQTKVTLRTALFDQLANNKGEHVVPFTGRHSAGAALRLESGSRGADFPPEFYTKPNLPSRMNGIFPETTESVQATRDGRAYFPNFGTPPKKDEE